MTAVLTETIDDARAWTAETIDGPESWSTPLPDECLDELAEYLTSPGETTAIRIGGNDLPKCRGAMSSVVEALNGGRGFVLVDRVPLDRFSDKEAQRIYWLIGQIIGDPVVQNIRGTLLFDVRDTGQDVKEGARFSVTNAESTFHTDGAFNPDVPDFVGLLCLKTANSGGESQLVSAIAVHNEVLENHRASLETLYGSFYFDRRSEFREGENPYTETPIYRWDGSELNHRYLKLYIEVGHERAGKPLTTEQGRALEIMQDLVTRKDLRVEFSLEPGQMLFTNNRWILHNRTAFEDHTDLDERRHYVRLWLSRR